MLASRYSDLKQAYGYDANLLLQHFVQWGMNEGRQAKVHLMSGHTTAVCRSASHTGNNLRNYYMHYIQWEPGRFMGTGNATMQNGLTFVEWRDYSAVYDYSYYISKNPDVSCMEMMMPRYYSILSSGE